MPVIAVVAAVGTLAAGGAAAIGSVIAGTATLLTTLEAVAAVGATISAIGAVTGDKDLQTAGMVIGGIGAVGSLATSAGVFGEAAKTESLFGSSTAAASDSANISSVSDALSQANAPTPDIVTSITNANPISGIADQLTKAGALSATAPSAATTAGTAGTDLAAIPKVADLTGLINTTPIPAPVSAFADTAAASTAANAAGAAPEVATPSGVAAGAAPPAPDIFSRLGHFISNDKSGLVGYGLVQSAGSFLSGATNPTTPAQVAALTAQADANRAAASISQMQQANMASPIPKASRAVVPQVTGVPTGIINTPQVAQPQITGAPA